MAYQLQKRIHEANERKLSDSEREEIISIYNQMKTLRSSVVANSGFVIGDDSRIIREVRDRVEMFIDEVYHDDVLELLNCIDNLNVRNSNVKIAVFPDDNNEESVQKNRIKKFKSELFEYNLKAVFKKVLHNKI